MPCLVSKSIFYKKQSKLFLLNIKNVNNIMAKYPLKSNGRFFSRNLWHCFDILSIVLISFVCKLN